MGGVKSLRWVGRKPLPAHCRAAGCPSRALAKSRRQASRVVVFVSGIHHNRNITQI